MEQRRFPVFAERFSKLREEMTQDEFAKYLGISRPTVGFYENGTRLPDALVLRQITEKCNVSADWLLGISDFKSSMAAKLTAEDLGLSETAATVLSTYQRSEATQILKTVNALLEGESLYSGHRPLQAIAAYLSFQKEAEYVFKIGDNGNIIVRDFSNKKSEDQTDDFLTDCFCTPLLSIDDQALFNEALYNIMCESLRWLKSELREKEEAENGKPQEND